MGQEVTSLDEFPKSRSILLDVILVQIYDQCQPLGYRYVPGLQAGGLLTLSVNQGNLLDFRLS